MKATAEWQKFALFCHRLAAMLNAGISLAPALQMLSEDEAIPEFRRNIDYVRRALANGTSFCSALRYVLPLEYRTTICRLEHIPDIPEFLTRLGDRVKHRADVVGTVLKDIIYPMLVISSTVGMVVFFVSVLVPRYSEFFVGAGIPLPPVLKGLMGVSEFLSSPLVYIGGCGTGASLLFFGRNRVVSWLKSRAGQGDGRADLFWMLGLLLRARVPLVKALDVVDPRDPRLTRQWCVFRKALVTTGEFAENAYLYLGLTRFQREMILCGERSAGLASALVSVATDLTESDAAQFKRSMAWVQPVMLVISGLTILMSIYVTLAPVTALANI